MKKFYTFILAALLVVSLAGCGDTTTNIEVVTATDSDITEMQAELDEIDGLYIGLLNDTTLTNSTNITIKDNVVTIKSGGEYTVTGTLDDGQIVVDTGDAVTLNLLNVTIHNEDGPAIYIEDADGATTINLVAGFVNTLSDGETHSDEETTAVLYSKDTLYLDGSGTLIIEANTNDGIVSKDSFTIYDGVYIINSEGDAIYGKDDLTIEGGDFSVVTYGGSAEAPVIEESFGRNSFFNNEDDEGVEGSQKALKSEGTLTINGGSFYLDAYDDAIHSDTVVLINGGDITLLSGDDGIHSDELLTVNSGTLTVEYSAEGLESFSIVINDGTFDINAYDDGLNATSGTNTSVGGAADDPDYSDYDLDTDPSIIINGGTMNVVSGGDGIDANGVVLINGGYITVNGKGTTSGMVESPIDFDITGIITGGTVLATGTSMMAYEFDDEDSTQVSFVATFGYSYSAGSTIQILDSGNNTLVDETSSNAFQTIIFSCDELEQGDTYTLIIDGDEYTLTLSSTSLVTIAS